MPSCLISIIHAAPLAPKKVKVAFAEGSLNPERVFVAREVLAKHDENYMPPEVAEALKKSGKWKHATGEDYKK